MPKARPVSLHPLSFDEAIKALMGVNPKPQKKKQSISKQKPAKKSEHLHS